MDWTGFPYFLAVARAGSLRGAAVVTGATHATVDRQVRALEAAFGAPLFHRTRSGMVLTPAGEALLPMAETAEDAVIGAQARLLGLDRQPKGVIRVSVPPVLAYTILPEILSGFSTRHPGIELQIGVTNRFEDLARLEADVSVRVAYEVTQDVVGRKVVQTGVGIYGARTYLDQHLPNAGPQGEGLDWVSWAENPDVARWITKTPYARARVHHMAREVVMQYQMIRGGMGFGYLPALMAARDPDLVEMPGTEVEPNRWIWLLLHSDLRRTARVRLFVDYLAEALVARKAEIAGRN
ncbi:LysR family transcriptional regulator [Shimia biformata]|uniref:LysR family transcriptional regulator n=1 Tax=Shimia biformata TaxID=1294299 RepID=UPI001950C389|nr:LysR family transcriptional regulator [Shimia biformata]